MLDEATIQGHPLLIDEDGIPHLKKLKNCQTRFGRIQVCISACLSTIDIMADTTKWYREQSFMRTVSLIPTTGLTFSNNTSIVAGFVIVMVSYVEPKLMNSLNQMHALKLQLVKMMKPLKIQRSDLLETTEI